MNFGDKAVLGVTLIGIGFLLGISVPQAEAKRETDAQKWERLKQHRAKRRAIEQRYQSCLKECLK